VGCINLRKAVVNRQKEQSVTIHKKQLSPISDWIASQYGEVPDGIFAHPSSPAPQEPTI
jgi:hypothetical protein